MYNENGLYHIIEVERYNEHEDEYVDCDVYLGSISRMRNDITKDPSLFPKAFIIDSRVLINRSNEPRDNILGLMRASLIIEEQLSLGRDIIVCCGLGQMRSVLVLTYWLSSCCGYSWKNAFNRIHNANPHAMDKHEWIELGDDDHA